MPLEIKELLVKIVVDKGTQETPSASGSNQDDMEGDNSFIKSIVDQVLEILREKEER